MYLMNDVVSVIKENGIVVMKTDTLYGLIASAFRPEVVARLYMIKNRISEKPFIILIESINDLKKFGIVVPKHVLSVIKRYWPGPTSIIFQLPQGELENFFYLHRGVGSLAFRIPQEEYICDILRETGPLVAPSANPEGKPVAQNILEAKKYFSWAVDYYKDDGSCEHNKASTIIKILPNGEVEIVRE